MKQPVVFKTFRTYGNRYVYDRHRNTIIIVDEMEYEEFRKVEKGELLAEQSAVIRKYQRDGLFIPNVVEKIEHPATRFVEQYLKTRLSQLTLQVTKQCNLRCEYCAYSGIYENRRVHENVRMDWSIAKKAIDFFLEKNRELPIVTIGFYGGEPLLEFELIKCCVEYARSKVEGKTIMFSITTNGTLLSDEVIDFLYENNFSLAISLDGSKTEHDKNRKFVNGKGSFDLIMKNINRIKEKYPDYGKTIMILTTINPYIDLECTLEFFNVNDVLNDKHIIFNSMVEDNLKSKIEYEDRYYCIRKFEHLKMLLALVGKVDRKYVSKLAMNSKTAIEKRIDSLKNHIELSPTTHHNGPCIPGVNRLFVRTDGALFPCERVNELLEFFKIGTIEKGFDLERILRILNIGCASEERCKTCWNLKQCSMCANQIDIKEDLTSSAKLDVCSSCCDRTLFELYEVCVLNEFGVDIEEMRRI